MLLSRLKVKDGRIVTKDEVIVASDYIGSGFDIYQTGANSFEGRGIEYDTRGIIFKGNSLKEVQEKIKRHEGELTRIVINQDSITEGSKIVVNTDNHVNESAIAVTINESDCLVRFENGDEETVPIEAVSAFESMANDAEKCMKDAMGTVIVRKGGYSIVEGVGTDSGWFFVTGKGENEKFKTKSQAEEYMDNCIEEDNTQDQSPSETETKINELKHNMDAARARGYDTAPYQKEIDRLRSMDALSEIDKKMLSQGKYLKVILPSGMGEDLYTNNFTAAKEMAKEYGVGTRVVNLNENKDKYTGDPLTDKGKEIMASLKEQYGEEKGEQVFYAMKNSGQIGGIGDGGVKDEIVEIYKGYRIEQSADGHCTFRSVKLSINGTWENGGESISEARKKIDERIRRREGSGKIGGID